MGAGDIIPRVLAQFPVKPVVSAEAMLENMKSALGRGLPEIEMCCENGHTLSVVAGGPSLADTYKELSGYIAAINGSLGFLLDKGIVPNACGVFDPGQHMADVVQPDRRVRYFVASICAPRLFDKLIKARCHVELWHPSGHDLHEAYLREMRPDSWLMIGGGHTMGLRWINLGYVFGFRTFRMHGLDSSFKDDKTHAYPDWRDNRGDAPLIVDGYKTSLAFMQQVMDFCELLRKLKQDNLGLDIELLGEGLMQSCWRRYKAAGGAMSASEAFVRA